MRKFIDSFSACVVLSALAVFCCSCSPQAKKAAHLKKADGYFASGHYDQSEIEYMNVLQIEPLNPSAISHLALIYADQGRMGQVAPYLLKAKELQPDNLDVRIKLGMMLLSSGNAKGAQDEAEFVLSKRPADEIAPLLLAEAANKPELIAAARQHLLGLPPGIAATAPVQVALGTLEMREHHLPEAEAAFRRALAQDPKSAGAEAALGILSRGQNKLPEAEQAFKRASELAAPYSVQELAYARFKVQAGDTDSAQRALLEITAKTPDYLPAWILLAEIYATKKNFPESDAALAKVLTRDPHHPEAMLLSARLKLAQGETAQAVADIEKMLKVYPKAPQAHFQLALAQAAAGDLPKAIASLNQTLVLAPGFGEATALLGELSLRKGDASGAIALLKPLVQQRPDIIQARFLLADAYRRQGDFPAAIGVYQKIEQQFPRNPQATYWRGIALLQEKKLPEARAAFNHALELAPDLLLALDQLINLDLQKKNPAAAEQRVQAQIARNPKQSGPYVLLAKIQLAQNNLTQAESSLHRAIELQPDAPLAYLLLARVYTSSNQLEKALANYRAVTAKNPKDTEALMMTGTLSERKQDFPAARDAYEKVLALNPRFSPALNNLAYLYSEHFNQLDKAQELAQKAKELLPQEPHTGDTLGWILYRRHQYPWALTLLLESAAKLPDSGEVQYHLGMTHYMMGEEGDARIALQRALQLEKDFPGHEEAARALSVLDLDPKSGGPAAVDRLEKMTAERPDDPVVLTRLGAAYAAAGSADKAIATYQKALEKNPDNVTATIALIRAYASNKETAKAFELAKNARKVAPNNVAITQLLGRLAYQTGDYPWAASLLQEAARKNPNDVETLFDLGEAAYAVGQVDDASAAMRSVSENKLETARRADAQRFLSMVALSTKPAVEAAAQIDQILKESPNYVPALMARAALDSQQGDLTGAKALYEKALGIFPTFVPAKRGLVIFYAENPEDDKKAYDLAVTVRDALPNDADVAKAFGIIVYRKGDFTRAASLLQESAQKNPQDAETWYYLGTAQAKLKLRTESRKSLQHALDLKLKPELAKEAAQLLAQP
jgi:tetratricopeptide (TPR) repeat protein